MTADGPKLDSSAPAPNGHAGFRFDRDAQGRLVLIDAGGLRHVGVEPVRAFPLSDPNNWVAICNAEGHELVTIASPEQLSAEVRATLEAELARREFLPVIDRIVDVALDVEPCAWTVETDRGPTTFFVDGADAVRRLDEVRCLVVDTHGVRYLIVDRLKLDAQSRRWLEHYL